MEKNANKIKKDYKQHKQKYFINFHYQKVSSKIAILYTGIAQ